MLALTLASDPLRPVVLPVGVADARWTDGLWAERFETARAKSLPAMTALMRGTVLSHFLENFRVASGAAAGTHRGPAWNDGDCYKWLEGAARIYGTTKDAALDRTLDEAIAEIAAAQRNDGYLHTPVLIANRNGNAKAVPFGDRFDFEMYNFGHLFTAAAVHKSATGKTTLLAVAERAADFLIRTFDRPTSELARNTVCPSHYMGLLDLARATQKTKYRDFAVKLFDLRDRIEGGTDDNQDRVPFRKQTAAAGHAVRANYLYAGAADLYAETGDATLVPPLQSIWKNVATRKVYITGACGALYDGASPDGSKDQKQITRVHQSYGRDYQLPLATAHNETCAAVGNVLWNERMLRAFGEAKYADAMEVALLNAVLVGVGRDGTTYTYTNALRQIDDFPVPLRWSRSREEWISCYCCPPNVFRTIAASASLAYGRSERGVWVHLYGGSTLDTTLGDGDSFKLTQTTDYPWDGAVRITIREAPPAPRSLFLRIPAWAAGATLSINGVAEANPKPGTYCELRRAWKSGDAVALTLPITPRWVEANPFVEECRGQVAAMAGPVVYCLESNDAPAGVKVAAVSVSAGEPLAAERESSALGRYNVLKSRATAAPDRPWGQELYRDAIPVAAKPIDLRLIPYALWGNRGRSEMSVWLPIGKGPP